MIKKFLNWFFEWLILGSKRYRNKIEKREKLFNELYELYKMKVIDYDTFRLCMAREISVII